MKNFGVLVFGLFILSGMIVGCSSKEEVEEDEIIAYNDNIRIFGEKCIEAGESMRDTYSSYNGGSTEDVKSAIDSAVSECKDSMFQINDMENMDGDSSLKDGVILLIQKMLEQYEKLDESLQFLPLLDEGLGEEDAETYETIVEDLGSLSVEIQDLNKNVLDIQHGFAEKYGYLVED